MPVIRIDRRHELQRDVICAVIALASAITEAASRSRPASLYMYRGPSCQSFIRPVPPGLRHRGGSVCPKLQRADDLLGGGAIGVGQHIEADGSPPVQEDAADGSTAAWPPGRRGCAQGRSTGSHHNREPRPACRSFHGCGQSKASTQPMAARTWSSNRCSRSRPACSPSLPECCHPCSRSTAPL